MANLGVAMTMAATSLVPAIHPIPRSVAAPFSARIARVSARSIPRCSISSPTNVDLEPSSTSASAHSVKDLLEDLKAVGRMRIIVNTGVGVLESVVPSLDKLFYKDFPGKGEYANLMIKEDNVDFHLLVDKVSSAKLIQGKSMQGNITTYMVRFFDESERNVASLMVMWRPDEVGAYDDGQVGSFKDLIAKYGSDVKFSCSRS